ncbi:hypothetical protein TcG_03203 [Trypanosoma cruzi]|nr:hypothetical protein TcBrA4_0025330 [Trypanosoma cruzi]PBJ75061.1 hypothetical protein BCY84_11780 [Trypanosoma cruzi cruzi]RNF21210.1 hypothetical protein TcG_03203 [Trypanosoma cruzi]
MPAKDLSDLLNVPVPTHAIQAEKGTGTRRGSTLRSRMHPIAVTDYGMKPTPVARSSRKQQLQAEILDEINGRGSQHRMYAVFYWILFLLMIVGVARAVFLYWPEFW